MSCDCCSETSSYTLPSITGSNGIYGGYSSNWKFETSVAAGATAQFLRLNNATYSAVTIIYISDTNANSTNFQAFLDSLANSAVYGMIRLFKEFDANTHWYGTITNVVDNGTYHTITVTYTSSNGTFAADDAVVVTFSPRGNTGATGTAGKGIFHSFCQDPETPYVEAQNKQVYTDLVTIMFPGTAAIGTFTTIRGVAWTNDATNSASFRIYDVTNSLIIAEQTGITSVSTANIIPFTTTPLGNLSTGLAVWKVQGMNALVDADDRARIGSIALY